MTAFSIVAALLMAGALLFILPTLLRKKAVVNRHALRDEVNLTVLRDQLRELDADLAAGTIDASAYESARLELERRVAEDVQPGVAATASAPDKRWTAVVVGLTVPLVAISLYFLLGSAAGLDPTQAAAPKDQAHAVTEEQIVNMVAGLALLPNHQADSCCRLRLQCAALGRNPACRGNLRAAIRRRIQVALDEGNLSV